mmetsp:Transcript_59540/g.112274  ORF Transcript_59540/g.112274 Transcript_59540/m.112274 type:complete len:225 (-) Transcript_59540:457-1131(-)
MRGVPTFFGVVRPVSGGEDACIRLTCSTTAGVPFLVLEDGGATISTECSEGSRSGACSTFAFGGGGEGGSKVGSGMSINCGRYFASASAFLFVKTAIIKLNIWKKIEAELKKTDTHFSDEFEFVNTRTKIGASDSVVITKTHWKKRMLLFLVATTSLLMVPKDCKREKQTKASPSPKDPSSSESSSKWFLNSSRPTHKSDVTEAYDMVLSPMCWKRPTRNISRR